MTGPILSLLSEMHGRLGMFVGTTSLSRLADFLRGYEHAIQTVSRKRDTFLANFRDWIQNRSGIRTRSWEGIILDECDGDEEGAVERFWILVGEFVKEKGQENVNSSRKAKLLKSKSA